MERFDTDYSYKYIPIPLKKQHKTQLISKIEKMIKRMRWKALELLGKLYSNNNTKTYGFQKMKSYQIQQIKSYQILKMILCQ